MTEKLYRFDGPPLERLKGVYRANLAVEDSLASRTCVACTRAEEGNLWYSAAGQREYERTGICEKCWDLLAQDGISAFSSS
ncbi:unnamed protein product, partial [Effrenium voratum]